MILAIEIVVSCLLLTLFIVPKQIKDPVSQIASYPPAIRKRVETLPQYSGTIKQRQKGQITFKIVAALCLAIAFGVTAYFSEAKTFGAAFIHVFIWFLAINLFIYVK